MHADHALDTPVQPGSSNVNASPLHSILSRILPGSLSPPHRQEQVSH